MISVNWQEAEIQRLRWFYNDERKVRKDLEKENEKLKAEIEVLKEKLLEVAKK